MHQYINTQIHKYAVYIYTQYTYIHNTRQYEHQFKRDIMVSNWNSMFCMYIPSIQPKRNRKHYIWNVVHDNWNCKVTIFVRHWNMRNSCVAVQTTRQSWMDPRCGVGSDSVDTAFVSQLLHLRYHSKKSRHAWMYCYQWTNNPSATFSCIDCKTTSLILCRIIDF